MLSGPGGRWLLVWEHTIGGGCGCQSFKDSIVFSMYTRIKKWKNNYTYTPSKRINHIPSNDCWRKGPPVFFWGETCCEIWRRFTRTHPPLSLALLSWCCSFSQGPFSTSMLIVARANKITHHLDHIWWKKTLLNNEQRFILVTIFCV